MNRVDHLKQNEDRAGERDQARRASLHERARNEIDEIGSRGDRQREARGGVLILGGGFYRLDLNLREGKGWLYEGGIRTPLLAKWPGNVKASSTSDVPVCGIDLLPTLRDACGLEQKKESPDVDGVSRRAEIQSK